jgi:hypothetical protein
MVLPWEMPSDVTDVELYGESDCGEEMRLQLLGPAGALVGSGRKSRLMPQNLSPGDNHTTTAADLANRPQTFSPVPG